LKKETEILSNHVQIDNLFKDKVIKWRKERAKYWVLKLESKLALEKSIKMANNEKVF